MHKVHVAFACDDAYAKLAGVALQSLLNSFELADSPLPEGVCLVVYIIDLGIQEASVRKLEHIAGSSRACPASLVVLPFDILEAMQPVLRAHEVVYHPQCFATFFLTELLPEDCGRVIFLDCDVLVRRSIVDLWQVDLGDFSIAAAREICAEVARLDGFWRRSCNPMHWVIALGSYVAYYMASPATKRVMRAAEPILNSGVMLMDIAKLRAMGFKGALVDLAVKNLGLSGGSGDQDIISLLLRGHYLQLPYVWNTHFFLPPPLHALLLTEQERADVLSQGPRIVHFSGPISCPWIRSADPEHQFHAEWVETLDSTPWAGWRPTNAASSVMERLLAQHHETKEFVRSGATDPQEGA